MPYFDRDSQCRSDTLTTFDSNKPNKIYSLMPDLLTGWKPKNIKLPSPILIKYKSALITQILQRCPQNVIYLGPRHSNSFLYHQQIPHQYSLKYGITTEDIPHMLRQQLSSLSEQDQQENGRQFVGMKPNQNHSLVFDSMFQSGNLDMVLIKGNPQQKHFNLFMRPDTNTCGHMQWFYFSIKNTNKCKVRLSICNNTKPTTLFQRGMKPYILSSKKKTQYGQGWMQGGENLSYARCNIREQIQDKQSEELPYQNCYSCLTFEYEFQYQNDLVYFAYCPPYTFSQLKNTIFQLKKQYNTNETIISQQKFCSSLSGLDIPLLTITDPSTQLSTKNLIIATGRIHPGESNSSYVIQGFIRMLLSQQSRQLRKHTVFKIIPMINVDGVVFGNYRTSLSGKDLNRQFRNKGLELLPEVQGIKKLIKRFKDQGLEHVQYFFDFHGHSMKKNVFFYGPEYDIWSIKYQKARILPKIISHKTQMFRMKSCIFKVASFKKTTARAFMLTSVPYCYTIQSSVGMYCNRSMDDCRFNISKWMQVGHYIAQAIKQIMEKMYDGMVKARCRKLKKVKSKGSLEESKDREEESGGKNVRFVLDRVRSKKLLQPIHNIKKRTINDSVSADINDMTIIGQQQCQSDHFSEGNSDCQSDQNDLSNIQYLKLRANIVKVIDNFQIMMIGKKCGQGQNRQKKVKIRKKKELVRKKSEEMLLVPSLKHRLGEVLSQKRIVTIRNLGICESSKSRHYKMDKINDSANI